MYRVLRVGVLTGVLLLSASHVYAKTHYFPHPRFKSLQAALDKVRSGDTIIVRDGTYTGSENKNLDFAGKAIILRSENGPDHCVIDCEGDGRGFFFHTGETSDSVIDGFTIRNGVAPGGWLEADGGGIYCRQSSPAIRNCIITDNTAYHNGGGIYCEDSSATISECTIANNRDGGGVYCVRSAVDLVNCTISGNAGLYGTGVFCLDSPLSALDCIITDNVAESTGGGIQCQGSSPSFTGCAISRNEGMHYGGGIYCFESSPTFTDCMIEHNTAGFGGGGLYSYGRESILRIEHSTITGNTAGHGGGGLSLMAAAEVTDCLIAFNSSNGGGGIWCDSGNLVVAVTNCVIIGNSSIGDGGGIESRAATVLRDCVISENRAKGDGGGVSCRGPDNPPPMSAQFFGCTITRNSAGGDGGGIYCFNNCEPVIADCEVRNNLAAGRGGGLHCYDYCSPDISDSIIDGNTAGADGGGIYCFKDASPIIGNSLITHNSAGNNGGGLQCNGYFAMPTVSNCTITGNSAPNGGAAYCFGSSTVTILDSILWGNVGSYGPELMLAHNSTMNVSFSTVQGGAAAIYLEPGCNLNWDEGNMADPPLFTRGPLGDYYLSQTAAGQGADSPCADAGSDTAANIQLDSYTTRTDQVGDSDLVDLGYHYPIVEMGELTRIDLMLPPDQAHISSPPTFVWTVDAGTNTAFAVDIGFSPGGPFYSTYENPGLVIKTERWTMPQSIWNMIPSSGAVYWRVRGMDLDAVTPTIITSDDVWSFDTP